MAWTGTHYVAAYVTHDGDLTLLRLSAAGAVMGTPVKIESLEGSARSRGVDLVWNGSDLALAWTNGAGVDSTMQVKTRRFDANLTPHGPAVTVTNLPEEGGGLTGAYAPRLAWCGDEYVVTFAQPGTGVHFMSVCD